jgi:hypothetical protein
VSNLLRSHAAAEAVLVGTAATIRLVTAGADIFNSEARVGIATPGTLKFCSRTHVTPVISNDRLALDRVPAGGQDQVGGVAGVAVHLVLGVPVKGLIEFPQVQH